MKNFICTTIFIITALTFTACSVSKLFTLKPEGEEVEYEQGREVAIEEDNYAFSTLQFEEHADANFILYLFLVNKSDQKLLFDPADITVFYLDKNRELLEDPLPIRKAIDPEAQIDYFNNEIKARGDVYNVNTGLNVAFTLISVAADLSDDDSESEAEEIVENAAGFALNQIDEEIDYQNDLDYLNSQKAFWQNEVLRKTHLSKDEELGGIIFTDINPDAKFIKVTIPIGETEHNYLFKQITIN